MDLVEDKNTKSILICLNHTKDNIVKSILSKYRKEIKTCSDLINLINRYKSLGKGVKKEKFNFLYSKEESEEKWKTYTELQSKTNTFEYKNQKYGMDKESFDAYNKNRAVTLENCIRKHGDEKGKEVFENYRVLQAYTNTKEHLGEERYNKINRLKSHTYEVYLERYGSHEAAIQHLEMYAERNKIGFVSKNSQELCRYVDSILSEEETSYYSNKNKEYVICCSSGIFAYDFTCTTLQFIIEYDGDHFHANPKIYKPSDRMKVRGLTKLKAEEIWERDRIKQNAAIEHRGYDVIRVWESDWLENNEQTKQRLLEYVKQRRIFLGL
jgi:very-short-patch-repair endonuclease